MFIEIGNARFQIATNIVFCNEEGKIMEANIEELNINNALDAWGRDYPNLDQSVLEEVKRRILNAGEVLDLSNLGLTSLPPGIWSFSCLSNLKKIYLADNKLQTIPHGLVNLQTISYLDFSYNHLLNLPEELGELENLEDLYCSHNNLSNLPGKLGQLKGLNVLNCSHNNLLTIPYALRGLTNLKSLDCSYNNLSTIPVNELFYLPMISLCNIRNNPLEPDILEILREMSLVSNIFLYDLPTIEVKETLEKLYGDDQDLIDKIQCKINNFSMYEVEGDLQGAVKNFLHNIQHSMFWSNEELFQKYIKGTLVKILSDMEVVSYEKEGRTGYRPNNVLQDINKAGEGCATNGTGTILSYYMQNRLEEWRGLRGKDKISLADINSDHDLKNDILLVSMQDECNTLINDMNIDGDRAEIVAHLLRICAGEPFKVKNGSTTNQVSNGLSFPASISCFGIPEYDDCVIKRFLGLICKDGSFEIDQVKIDGIINRYLMRYDLLEHEDNACKWSHDLCEILRKEEISVDYSDEIGQKKLKIYELYRYLALDPDFCVYHEIITNLWNERLLEKYAKDNNLDTELDFLTNVENQLYAIMQKVAPDEDKIPNTRWQNFVSEDSKSSPTVYVNKQ